MEESFTMNCHECARNHNERQAVAICPNCGVGMCIQHLDQERARTGPGGTQIGCGHSFSQAARQQP
jgi:hypothetical protein